MPVITGPLRASEASKAGENTDNSGNPGNPPQAEAAADSASGSDIAAACAANACEDEDCVALLGRFFVGISVAIFMAFAESCAV